MANDISLGYREDFWMLETTPGRCEGSNSTTVLGYDISHATTILQIFLTSPKPVIRLGA